MFIADEIFLTWSAFDEFTRDLEFISTIKMKTLLWNKMSGEIMRIWDCKGHCPLLKCGMIYEERGKKR